MADLGLERDALALFEELLDIAEGERDAWLDARAGDRPALLARVRAMLKADRSASMRTGAAIESMDEEVPPERIGAYRIVRRIGRGGMGSVYLGERMTGDFVHHVAIKIIKPGLLSETLVERFERERQTLASLTHPGIAQLYDGGETAQGSPYFIMEYVDGLPLLEWVEANAPSRAGRQRLFRDICAAVAFAHRNLVVHRDLTPSNVLVTKDGTVKLIDFGIARPADEPHAPDAGRETGQPSIGSLSLTPGYAAPERMTSREVTTAADIFSLGKLLARLTPPAPRDRDLKAIIARATALLPADRYPTADALSADVAAWQNGFPVEAMGHGGRYRAGKFIVRNRVGVAAAAVAFALLIGAFALTLIANAQARRALAQSQARFEQTRGIAKALLFDAYDRVSRVPGSTGAREALARTGLAYIEALAADPNAPLDVRIEAGRGYLRLAQVVGGGLSSQLGRFQDANALLARADEILAPLVRDHPDSAEARRALAALRIEQSAVNLYNNNEVDHARAQAREAQTLLQPNPAANAEAARLTGDAMRAEGDTYLWAEDFARARAVFLSAEAFMAGLPPAMQRDPAMAGVRAGNLRYLGEAYHSLRQEDLAQSTLARAVALHRAVLATQPDDPLLRRRVITTLRYQAIVYRTDHRAAPARESIEQARTETLRLRERDPNDVGAVQLFAVVSEVYMEILSDLGRNADAYRIGDEIRAAYRILVDRAGNAPGQLRSMAMALRSEAEVHYNGGDHAGACRAWSDVLTILAGLDRRGALTATDRHVALTQTQDYVRRACNPPRAGLGAGIPG